MLRNVFSVTWHSRNKVSILWKTQTVFSTPNKFITDWKSFGLEVMDWQDDMIWKKRNWDQYFGVIWMGVIINWDVNEEDKKNGYSTLFPILSLKDVFIELHPLTRCFRVLRNSTWTSNTILQAVHLHSYYKLSTTLLHYKQHCMQCMPSLKHDKEYWWTPLKQLHENGRRVWWMFTKEHLTSGNSFY